MSALTLISLAIGMPLLALGLSGLQAKLERWDQQRHAED
jgi:hypothetical protein